MSVYSRVGRYLIYICPFATHRRVPTTLEHTSDIIRSSSLFLFLLPNVPIINLALVSVDKHT